MKRKTDKAGGGNLPFPCAVFHPLRKGARRAAALLLCLTVISNLCACWNRHELNTLGIVLGTGLDTDSLPDTLTLTAQFVRANEIKAAAAAPEGGSRGKAYVNVSNTDKSIPSILKGISRMTNRNLYFSHNKVLIFGSDLAKQGIKGLDIFLRNFESRMNIYIIVSRQKASKILEEEPELEKIPAVHIAEMIENPSAGSETAVITLRDFAIALLSGTTAPVAPMVELYEAPGGKQKVRLQGTAVFKEGKMVGEFDKSQTKGLLRATAKTSNWVTTLDTKGGQAVLEFTHFKNRLKPVKTKDDIKMVLEIKEEGFIDSVEGSEDLSVSDKIEALKKLEEEAVRAEVKDALDKARSLHADVFGFGEAIRREFPREWEEMKKNWDEVFPTIELEIKIEIKLHASGGLTKPVTPGGAA